MVRMPLALPSGLATMRQINHLPGAVRRVVSRMFSRALANLNPEPSAEPTVPLGDSEMAADAYGVCWSPISGKEKAAELARRPSSSGVDLRPRPTGEHRPSVLARPLRTAHSRRSQPETEIRFNAPDQTRGVDHVGAQSRLRKFEQVDKWNFCLTTAIVAANRRDHEQTTAQEPYPGL
jgi:hypothetical protein